MPRLRLTAAALVPALALLALWPGPGPAQEARLVLPAGAPEDLRTTLENASLTLSLGREGLTQGADYVAAARADYRRLLTGLYAEGYYGGTVSIAVDGREASAIAPLDAPDAIREVVLAVTPGPRFAFGRTAVGPLAPGTALPSGFAPGETARSETVREAVRAAVAAWRDEGNAKAAVASQQITAVHPEARLDVAVAIDPGPVLSFGPVTVSGNAAVRTDRILRIAGIREGQTFTPLDLGLAATRLRRTGTFDAVAVVEAEAPGPGDTLPIDLQVTESLPRRVGFAAEISSLDGVAASAFWLHRNLLGGAERLRLEAEVSDIGAAQLGTNSGDLDFRLGASFARPATFAADNDLTIDAAFEREDAEDFRFDQVTFEFGITRYASDDLTVEAAVGLLAAHEVTAVESRDYVLLTLPLSATRDKRDDRLDARAGTFLDADVTPFVSVAGDGGHGARLYADARLYRSFGRVTLAGRAQAGSVAGPDREEAPQDFLFFSGGGGSVRGQPFQDLGVEVPDPDEPDEALTLGGASFAGAQIEARVGITDSLGAVAFYDAGLVGPDPLPDRDARWHAGTGLGVRYDTAIGPIRLDVATPATGDDAFGAVQLYIGIGQAF